MAQFDLLSVRDGWLKTLRLCVQADKWGQMLEAQEDYERLAVDVNRVIGQVKLTAYEQTFLQNLSTALQSRATYLCRGDISMKAPSVDDMETIRAVLKRLFNTEDENQLKFPFDMRNYDAGEVKGLQPTTIETNVVDDEDVVCEIETLDVCDIDDVYEEKYSGAPTVQESTVAIDANTEPSTGKRDDEGNDPFSDEQVSDVVIGLQKIGLLDFDEYLDANIQLSVRGKNGILLEPTQLIPCATKLEKHHVPFKQVVKLTTSFEALVKANGAIFFEFVHWKVNKHRMSTRCWSVLEVDELFTGEKVMQLYAKPVNIKRKSHKFLLFSKENLYMHTSVQVSKRNVPFHEQVAIQ